MTDVVLPCLDEAAALPWILARMPDGFRPIVADNGSTDGSPEVARAYGARVVPEPRPGIPAAAATGYDAADGDIIARCDADSAPPPDWVARRRRDRWARDGRTRSGSSAA